MATFIEPHYGPNGHPSSAPANYPSLRPSLSRSNTMENVAEEMLNGIFCHYEPPESARHSTHKKKTHQQKKYTGILKAPRLFHRASAGARSSYASSPSGRKTVRWKDHVQQELEAAARAGVTPPPPQPLPESPNEPPVEIRCNVASACVDAGIELGLMSPSKKDEAVQFFGGGYDVPTPTASQIERQRLREKYGDDLVFDDEGNPVHSHPSSPYPNPPPPPPPPPPSRRERFIADLCGVRINCGEDERQLEELAKEEALSRQQQNSDKSKHKRVQKTYDYTQEEENSIVENGVGESDEEYNTDDTDEDDDYGPKEKEESEEEMRRKLERIRRSSGMPSSHKDKKDQKSPKNKEELKEKMRRKLKNKTNDARRDSAKDNTANDDEWETQSTTSSAFFSRMWPLRKGRVPTMGTIPEVETRGGGSPRLTSRRSRSHSPTHINSRKVPEIDPIEMNRGESPTSRGPSSPASKLRRFLNRTTNDDWDESIPIVPSTNKSRGRWSLPNFSSSTNSKRNSDENDPSSLSSSTTTPPPPPPSRGRTISRTATPEMRRSSSMDNTSRERNRSKSPRRSKSPTRSRPPMVPQRATDASMSTQSRRRSFEQYENQRYPAMHPAHPLNQPEPYAGTIDDRMERQSFITAHRMGYDISSLPPRNEQPRMSHDDIMERMSYITAHRQGFGDQALPQSPGPLTSYPMHVIPEDDEIERQSFITANRNGLDMASLAPVRRPSVIAHPDDAFERQSFITDHRLGFESPRGRSISPRRQQVDRRTRSQSPSRTRSQSPSRRYNRSHTFEQEYATTSVSGHFLNPAVSTTSMASAQNPSQARRSHEMSSTIPPIMTQQQGAGPSIHPVYSAGDGGPTQVPHGQQVPYQAQAYHQYQQPFYPYHIPPSVRIVGSHPYLTFDPQTGAPILIDPTVVSQMVQQTTPATNQPVEQPKPASPKEVKVEKNQDAKEEELTWEERTRLAWERLRGGVAASLNFEPVVSDEKTKVERNEEKRGDEDKVATSGDKNSSAVAPVVGHEPNENILLSSTHVRDELPQLVNNNSNRSPRQAGDEQDHQIPQTMFVSQQPQMSYVLPQPNGILRNGTDKRVTFGPPTEQIYNDDQSIHSMGSYLLPTPDSKKKKKRNQWFLSSMFDKARNGFGRIGLSKSRSSDTSLTHTMTASGSGSFVEGEEPTYYSNPPIYPVYQHPGMYPVPQQHPGSVYSFAPMYGHQSFPHTIYANGAPQTLPPQGNQVSLSSSGSQSPHHHVYVNSNQSHPMAFVKSPEQTGVYYGQTQPALYQFPITDSPGRQRQSPSHSTSSSRQSPRSANKESLPSTTGAQGYYYSPQPTEMSSILRERAYPSNVM